MWLKDKKCSDHRVEVLKKKIGQEKLEKALKLVQQFPIKKRRITQEPSVYRILR